MIQCLFQSIKRVLVTRNTAHRHTSTHARVGALHPMPSCLGIGGHTGGSQQGHPRYTSAHTVGRPWVAQSRSTTTSCKQHSSDANFRCKSSSGQRNGRSSKRFQPGSLTSEEQTGQSDKKKVHSLCFIDGHLSSQKCGVRTKITEV